MKCKSKRFNLGEFVYVQTQRLENGFYSLLIADNTDWNQYIFNFNSWKKKNKWKKKQNRSTLYSRNMVDANMVCVKVLWASEG